MYIILFNILLSILYIIDRSKRNIHMLQQNFYNENNRYIKWGIKNINEIFKFDLVILFVNIINLFINNKILIVVNILYMVLFVIENKRVSKIQVKLPLKVTNRVKRLMITLTVLYSLPIILYVFYKNIYLYEVFNSFLVSLNFYVIFIANFLNKGVEKCVFLNYKSKAVKKLKSMNSLNVIGITGSYGKTSSKNILNDILNVKYNAMTTPQNFNTQYGLIITINNYLDKYNDVFIAEMGAFKKGRIKLLCDLVKPKYGIITNIGLAHLETFGSEENIQEGKFELIESLPKDGVGILNMDDPKQVSYKLKNNCKIIWIGIDNKKADIYASNIKIDANGMTFDVTFKNDNMTYEFFTKLLGKANIYNILAGIAFGKYLGMSLEELSLGVKKVKPIEHRLELKRFGDKIIIDDAYNSNPVGSKMALDVLKLMDGKKIVVTPGMIELGEKQYDLNYKFGEYISEVADYVILVGEQQTKPIMDGLKAKKYKNSNIKVIKDVKDAFKIINEIKDEDGKTYILLENDLPDIFNEK